MKLESLANELLLYLFEFFNTIDLLRAFTGINARFNGLLFNNFRKYYINLQCISNKDFELVCQEYIPLIIDRIVSIHISDDDDTPQQLDLFLRHFPTFHQFPYLRSLSFYRLRAEKQVNRMILVCRNLPHLTHLSLIKCNFPYMEKDVRDLINIIWSLPNLIYCQLNAYIRSSNPIYAPTIISSSLKNVCIKGFDCNPEELVHLMEHTPRLQHLDLHIEPFFDHQNFPPIFSSMISLKIIIRGSLNWIKLALKNMPNLRALTIRISNRELDGYQWEEIIDNHLPKLKIFRLLIRFKTDNRSNKEEIVDTLLDSFRTPFWLDKHQWFVRADWNPSNNYNSISLYTLPYAFEDYDIRTAILCKSTCFFQNENDWSYNRVTRLIYNSSRLEDSIFAHVHFSNIRYLSLTLPLDDQFWSVVTRFDQLTVLDISLCNTWEGDTDIQPQLQALLDRAPRLYSLVIRSILFLAACIFEVTSLSIRRLHFQISYQFRNESDMHKLINSPLGIQCEVLQIGIENQLNILDLVNSMINLRAFKFVHKSDRCNCVFHQLLDINDNTRIMWLRHRLPSSLIISVGPGWLFNVIRIWIR